MSRQPSITPTDMYAIVQALEQAIARGAGPFLSVAAEQCGINPQTVAYWYHEGRKGDEAYATFFRLVAKMRADWKMDIQAKMMNADKDDSVRVQNMKYLLQCMDRDLFDLTKRVDPVRTQEPGRVTPSQVSPEDLETALEQLSGKGTVN